MHIYSTIFLLTIFLFQNMLKKMGFPMKKKIIFFKFFQKFFFMSIFIILSQIWTFFVENLRIWYFSVNCRLPWSVAVRFGYLTDQQKSVSVRPKIVGLSSVMRFCGFAVNCSLTKKQCYMLGRSGAGCSRPQSSLHQNGRTYSTVFYQ